MKKLHDLNVIAATPLITPNELKASLPMTATANETVAEGRETIQRILSREDRRLVAIVGPCSIHDPQAAIDYAGRLNELRAEVGDHIFLVMRTYFEKPRTVTGWKGLINDPNLDGSYDMRTGLHKARSLLLKVNEMGLPAATEVLDPIVPQYIADLVSWAAIGARTTESQTHRELASGLSMPVGFKNSTDGNLRVAFNALLSARQGHHFLGIDQDGRTAVIETRGNPFGHIILRGGQDRPNYDPVSIAMTEEQLKEEGLPPLVMIDCSHDNSGKRPRLQAHVLKSIVQQRLDGDDCLIGFMLESNIEEGNQPLNGVGGQRRYGLSITDACLGWDETASLLRFARDELDSGAHAGTMRKSFTGA